MLTATYKGGWLHGRWFDFVDERKETLKTTVALLYSCTLNGSHAMVAQIPWRRTVHVATVWYWRNHLTTSIYHNSPTWILYQVRGVGGYLRRLWVFKYIGVPTSVSSITIWQAINKKKNRFRDEKTWVASSAEVSSRRHGSETRCYTWMCRFLMHEEGFPVGGGDIGPRAGQRYQLYQPIGCTTHGVVSKHARILS